MAISSVGRVNNYNSLTQSFQKLSSGKRINSAADDAAGLAIAKKMEAETAVLKQGSNNIKDGQSYLKVADGAMDRITSLVQEANASYTRMNNGILTDEDKAIVQNHINSIADSIQGLAYGTNFNGINVFSNRETNIQMGEDSMKFTVGEVEIDLSSAESTRKSLDSLLVQRANTGASYNRLEHAYNNNETMRINTTEALSTIADTDMAQEISNMKQLAMMQRMQFALMRKNPDFFAK